MAAITGNCNQPLSVVPEFTGDDLALIFGALLNDPVFVLDCEGGQIVAGNQRFLSLVGLDPEQPKLLDLRWQKVVHPEDQSAFRTWLSAASLKRAGSLEGNFSIRIIKGNDNEAVVDVTLYSLRWKQREYLIGFLRDNSASHRREAQLRKQVQEQKSRALEAIKSSLCVYELTEKIKSTPVLTTRLLDVENEEQLYQEAAKLLASEQGLGYRDVTFLLLEEGVLNVVFSTRKVETPSFPMASDSRFAAYLSGDPSPPDLTRDSILVPLRSRGQLLGFCEVFTYSREKVFYDEIGKVSEWQKDVLLTVGDILALLIDNLRLTREIRRQSTMDSLTNTYNRHYFVGRLANEIRRSGRYGRPISVLFVDVDEFKGVNDRYGHLQGDQVLKDLGKLFVKHLRQTDVVCRYGGDEFVALLPETDEAMAWNTAEKLLETVRQHKFMHLDNPEEAVPISISIGVSTLKSGENSEQFIKAADTALYTAKQRGRNCLVARDQRSSS